MKRALTVWGCQRCGSNDLGIPGLADGVIVGEAQEFSRMVCKRCGLTAVAIEFDDEAARRAYEDEQAKHPSKEWPESGWPSTTLGRRKL